MENECIVPIWRSLELRSLQLDGGQGTCWGALWGPVLQAIRVWGQTGACCCPLGPSHRRVPWHGDGVAGEKGKKKERWDVPWPALGSQGDMAICDCLHLTLGTFPYLPGYLVRAVHLGVNLCVFFPSAFVTVCSEQSSMHKSPRFSS